MKIKTRISLALAIFLVCQADAILIDNGNYTTDTVTGLDWLDIAETQRKSYNTTLSLLPTQYAGWRFATESEFQGLIANGVALAQSMLGFTGGSFTMAYLDSSDIPDARLMVFTDSHGYDAPRRVSKDLVFFYVGTSHYAVSSFLVRENDQYPPQDPDPATVPDSSTTLLLFGASIVGFLTLRRKFHN